MSTTTPAAGPGATDGRDALLLDSITSASPQAAGRIVVTGSHGGRYAAALALRAGVAAVIFNDASIGRDRAGVAGLDLLDAAGVPGAAVDHRSARIGDAADALARGELSVVNAAGRERGWQPGMRTERAVAVAAGRPAATARPAPEPPEEGRHLIAPGPVEIWALDSASLVREADAGAIVATGSHGGLVGGRPEAALRVAARAALFNDAGGGAGTTRLGALQARGIAAATVSAASARIGDGRSTYEDGVLSAVNDAAAALGGSPGMDARAFADLVRARAAAAAAAESVR
ncbi:hypothetical protein [Baekduia soli]|uniref:hypothetical protein n=1 Tax=Baekduia soli TaxID=496014 RepID=UPI001E3806E3|nr:hypothetical protein [Baekduia soli]